MTRPRRRITFDTTAEAGSQLDTLRKKSDKTLAEIIRSALAIYAISIEEIENGNAICFFNKTTGEVVKEIVLP